MASIPKDESHMGTGVERNHTINLEDIEHGISTFEL